MPRSELDDLVTQGVREGLHAMAIESRAIETTRERIASSMPDAVRLLWSATDRVVVSGLGKSGHIGAKIAATLASTGTPALFVHSAEALHGDSGMVTGRDVAILISYSGETAEVCQFARMLASRGVRLIALTKDPQSTLATLSDVWLSIEVDREADPLDLAPTASTASTLAVGDGLAAALMTMRGFDPVDFATHHPGGSLGAQLEPLVHDTESAIVSPEGASS